MKTKDFGAELILGLETIDVFSDRVTDYLREIKTDSKETVRIRLSVEDALLKWYNRFGSSVSVKLSCYSYLGQPTVRLALTGEPFNPLTSDDDVDDWSRKLMSGLQTTPLYSYSRNTNYVTFKLVRKRKSPLFFVFAAIALAVVFGFAGVEFFGEYCEYFAETYLSPICDSFIAVLDLCGIPIIFLSVTLGICGIGDASSFGKIGKKMIVHLLCTLALVTLVTALAAFPFFDFNFGSSIYGIDASAFLDMILGFLPRNLFSPFIESNAMQLIILAVLLGIALLKLTPVASGLVKLLDDINGVLVLLSAWFTRIIPLFIFSTVLKSIWTGQVPFILRSWKAWVIATALQILFLAVMIIQICIKHKVKIMTVLKKVSATFIISLGTNSAGAAFGEVVEASGNLGVDSRITNIGVPISTSVFKPSTAVRLIVTSYFIASSYSVNVSTRWFILAAFIGMVFSIAVPAMPGGVVLFYPMLFTQLGLPAELIPAMIAVDLFFDATCTAFCQVSAEIALVEEAGMLGLLDEERLKKL